MEGRAQASPQVPLFGDSRTRSHAFVLLNADKDKKGAAILLEFVRAKVEGHSTSGQIQVGPCRAKSATNCRQTDLGRMASHQLKSSPLRLPVREEAPPAHPAWLLPGGAFGFVIVKDHARGFRNRQRSDRFVSDRPARLPTRTFD